jgi:hypothetical protein
MIFRRRSSSVIICQKLLLMYSKFSLLSAELANPALDREWNETKVMVSF